MNTPQVPTQNIQTMKKFEASLAQYFDYLQCYPHDKLVRIKYDICQALYANPLMVPGYAPLRTPAGLSKQVVVYIHGAIQIKYYNNIYNVPMNVFISPSYPSTPPFCFVIPNPKIMIKPRNKHCDSQGIIYHPMISQWNSNLTISHLLVELVKVFSGDPPIMYTTVAAAPSGVHPPPGNSPPPSSPTGNSSTFVQTKPPPNTSSPPVPSQESRPPSYSAASTNAPSTNNFSYAQYQSVPPTTSELPAYLRPQNASSEPTSLSFPNRSPPVSSSSSFETLKRTLHNSLYERATQLRTEVVHEVREAESPQQQNFEFEEKRIQQQIQEKNLEIDRLTQEIQIISSWIDENSEREEVDPLEMSNETPREQQLKEARAADEAYDDILFELANSFRGRGFQNQTNLDCDLYLKMIRKIAREQFMEVYFYLLHHKYLYVFIFILFSVPFVLKFSNHRIEFFFLGTK